MKTGIFYHPSFSRRSYLTQGSRLQDFPTALEPLLTQPQFALYESPPIDDEWLLQVHTQALLDEVALDPLCSTAWHSAGGVVLAAEMIATNAIRNAFAFIGAGGHHAGRDFFGGYCCFNDVVIAIAKLRQVHGIQRFAILDTDAHHADGTRALVRSDPDVLHVCVCGLDQCSADGTKVDIGAPGGGWDGSAWPRPRLPVAAADRDQIYAETALNGFLPRVKSFHPRFIFWYFGFDTHRGDYGDLGLSRTAYLRLAAALKEAAEDLCGGRLEVVLGGGSRSDIARDLIPPVIEILGR
ncbi:MAG: hypothetical protein AUK55_13515 [Syntrophobacteraceae bacterium CG2_30_61_12]|nr:MAG: hypothetical protein AUK55_13515 [Syntrophobacteraceae bacterium CG2_30_61_12]